MSPKKYSHRKYRGRLIRGLACVVVFFTVYALILPAITMDQQTAQQDPGITLETSQEESAQLTLEPTPAPTEAEAEPSAPSLAPEPSPAPSPEAPAQTPAPASEPTILTYEPEDQSYKVTAEFDESAALPSDVTLAADEITPETEGDRYAQSLQAAQAALRQQGEELSQTMGLRFFDIRFEQNGQEVEPRGAVQVTVDYQKNAPEVSPEGTVKVVHIQEKENAAPEADLLQQEKVQATVEKETAQSVQFESDSFSVFAIVWTVTKDNTTSTIGNVTIHYVDDSGMEIDRTAELNSGDLSQKEGVIVKIADWVNDATDETTSTTIRKVSGYKYKRAAIGTYGGPAITAVKMAETATTGDETAYQLYYTNASDPGTTTDWTLYTDSVSKNGSNNADIYLVFHSTAQRVNVHFVDEDGNILMNPIYHYADKTSTDGFSVKETDVDKNPWAEPIQKYEFTGRVHMGEIGWQGFAFSKVRAHQEGEIYRYQYQLTPSDSEDDWIDLTATDVYLIYKKSEAYVKKGITVKYVDDKGTPMKDEAGNSLDRVIDAADWTENTWQNLQGYSENIDGYTINDMALIQTDNGDSNYTLDVGSENKTNGLEGDSRISGVEVDKSRAFRYLRYTKSGFQAGNGHQIDAEGGGGTIDRSSKTAPDSKINRYWTINGAFTVYLVYVAKEGGKTHSYTVHYVDESGTEIATTGNAQNITTNLTLVLTADNGATNVSQTISNYTATGTAYLGRATAETGGIAFTSITFTKDETNNIWIWKYQIGSGPQRQLNLSNLNIYVVYKKTAATDPDKKTVTVHFVDTHGNPITNKAWPTRITLNKAGTVSSTSSGDNTNVENWNGWDFTNTSSFGGSQQNNDYKIPAGYTFVGEYIGPEFNMDPNKLVTTTAPNAGGNNAFVQWIYKDSKWYISHGSTANATHELTDSTVFEGYITDIYWVYAKPLSVHYIYVNKDNKLAKIDGQTDGTVTPGAKGSVTQLSSGDIIQSVEGKIHIGTRLGPSWSETLTGADLGTRVSSVYAENGQNVFSFSNSGAPYTLEKQGNNDMWVFADPSGRRFVLRKTTTSSGTGEAQTTETYTIEDSQHGTFTLNMSAPDTYVATFHGEAETTEYTITKNADASPEQGSTTEASTVDSYQLVLKDYIPSNLTDVYEMYIDDTNEAKIWIEDDLKYSGYFMVARNQWLEDRMKATATDDDKITSYYYQWEKITTGTGIIGEKTATVERQQNGIHWNIAYNRAQRTWLDIEADNGGRNTTDQKTVKYRVTMYYRVGEGAAWQSVSSEPLAVEYYSQLMNGGFETPVSKEGSVQWSNAAYKENDGVWQTTGIGIGNHNNHDIEIVNVSTAERKSAVARSYSFINADAVTAAEGDQFAELNCETAGALYQDVVTHPDQYLNYWLSHRARGKVNNATPEYDTMYLIIMPTKLAMTSAPNGGELKTQADLRTFIQNHGGYDTSLATAVGQEVTYRDETNGIFIEKISSSDQFWHKVNVANGYTAKGGLTRFFFAAGPTAADGVNAQTPTQGNFIDGVGFDQELPTPEGFHLVVTKTFTGLTTDQIAGLVGNTDQKKNFQITITNKVRGTSGGDVPETETGGKPNSALNNAVLSFTYTPGATIPFTATAVDGSGKNLLTGDNRGSVRLTDSGITITWTFQNQTIDGGSGDQTFNYYAAESGADVAGHTLSKEETVSPTDSPGPAKAAVVTQSTEGNPVIARFTFQNSYKDQSSSDQPRIVVSKTFQGLTPAAVGELFSSGYQMTVTGPAGENPKTYALHTDPSRLDSNISFVETQDADHNTTVRWTIEGQDPGTYTISETGYNTTDYKITQIRVNGGTLTSTDNVSETVTIGGSTGAAKLTYDNVKKSEETATAGNLSARLPENTNLIIAQFTLSNTTNYFVWTPEPVGANVAQAILNKINGTVSDGKIGTDGLWSGDAEATLSNTYFRSGQNPGTISTQFGSFTYDSNTGGLALATINQTTASWNKYYSAVATGLDAADIRVENRYDPVVRIQKVHAGTSTPLSGAVFQLYTMENGTKAYVKDKTETDKPATFTTGADGTVQLPGLTAGTYFLEEIQAPDGYNRKEKPIAFTVNNQNAVVQATKDEGQTTVNGIDAETPTPDWNHPFYTITVENSPGVALPVTGGGGTWPMVALGAALALAGAWGLLRRRGRRAPHHTRG